MSIDDVLNFHVDNFLNGFHYLLDAFVKFFLIIIVGGDFDHVDDELNSAIRFSPDRLHFFFEERKDDVHFIDWLRDFNCI